MSPTTITLLFLVFAIVMFILEKIPLGLTATIVAVGLNVTGVLGSSDTFAGYVNSNVILCVGMFVVGQALFETGMANKIGGIVTKFAGSERILIIAIMVIVGVMSGFLSNTGTAAVLIPVVCGIADESGYSRGKLLMPLVFAAALGGNLSIIGAPGNLMGIEAMEKLGMQTMNQCLATLYQRRLISLDTALGASSIKPHLLQGVDLVVVRELTGGIYFGQKQRSADAASDLCEYSVAEITRVVLLKQGRVIADGPKHRVLTSAALSALFELPIKLIEVDGSYQAIPGNG